MASKISKILILTKLKNTKIKNISIIYVAPQGDLSFGSQLMLWELIFRGPQVSLLHLDVSFVNLRYLKLNI